MTAQQVATAPGYWLPAGAALVVEAIAWTATASVQIDGLFMGQGGDVSPFQSQMAVTPANTLTRKQLQVGPGWVVGVVVTGVNDAFRRGECFCRLYSAYSSQTLTPAVAVLAAGYVSAGSTVSFPESEVEPSTTENKRVWERNFTPGAVGAGWQFTANNEGVFDIVAFSAELANSAAVANRRPNLTLIGNTDNYWSIQSTNSSAAGITRTFYWAGIPAVMVNAAGQTIDILPRCSLCTGMSLVLGATNLDIGDQFTNVQALGSWYQDV